MSYIYKRNSLATIISLTDFEQHASLHQYEDSECISCMWMYKKMNKLSKGYIQGVIPRQDKPNPRTFERLLRELKTSGSLCAATAGIL